MAKINGKKRSHQDGSVEQSRSKPAKKAKTAARLDTLNWKEVSMPDRMDDYEGFFGLEEVDDVEVIKDEASGTVKYLAAEVKDPSTVEPESDDGQDDGEEWNGFEDGDEDSKPVEKAQPESKLSKTELKKDKKEKKKTDKKSKSSEGGQPIQSAFRALPENGEQGVSVEAWKPLKLSPDTMASLSQLKFGKPTPIQKAAIPEILAGHDVIGKASTGSGKTLAFGIPMLERYLESRATKTSSPEAKVPMALILSPTRELAHQLDKHLKALCSSDFFESPSIATLTGGLSIQKQQRLLKDADIVVGTPGRLWEVISSGHGVLAAISQIEFLVVDEADRLLSEGHFKEVEEILNALDRVEETNDDDAEAPPKHKTTKQPRQTLVFSATFDRGLQKKLASRGRPGGDLMSNKESLEYLLSKLNFREEKPKFVDVNPVNQLATGLKEGLVECVATEKDLYLYALLLLHPNTRTLVFTNSISAVRRLTPLLQNLNLPALALHSGMPQKARLRSIERFTQSKQPSNQQSSILIATDVAARGLDIANVQLVIHYHLPRAADTYVHRSGRTARANQTGSSILLCGPEEVAGVRRLVAKVHANSSAAVDENDTAKKAGFYIRTLDIDRRIVSRLKPRATLAKKLADTVIAKEKTSKEDDFLRAAAEELGVDYDSDEFEAEGAGKGRGRGGGRRKKERETAKGATKAEVAAMRAELKGLLKQRVNVGVSEKYLTSGGVDVDELLRQREAVNGTGSEFLGNVDFGFLQES